MVCVGVYNDLLLVIVAAVLHSTGFFFNSKVEKTTKPGFSSAIIFATVSWMEILFSLLIIMRGEIAFTPFSLIMSSIHSILVIICSFIALKALIFADVAKYSLYMMLGGMLVPFVFGIAILYSNGFPDTKTKTELSTSINTVNS